jgi:hypothetical protein
MDVHVQQKRYLTLNPAVLALYSNNGEDAEQIAGKTEKQNP